MAQCWQNIAQSSAPSDDSSVNFRRVDEKLTQLGTSAPSALRWRWSAALVPTLCSVALVVAVALFLYAGRAGVTGAPSRSIPGPNTTPDGDKAVFDPDQGAQSFRSAPSDAPKSQAERTAPKARAAMDESTARIAARQAVIGLLTAGYAPQDVALIADTTGGIDGEAVERIAGWARSRNAVDLEEAIGSFARTQFEAASTLQGA